MIKRYTIFKDIPHPCVITIEKIKNYYIILREVYGLYKKYVINKTIITKKELYKIIHSNSKNEEINEVCNEFGLGKNDPPSLDEEIYDKLKFEFYETIVDVLKDFKEYEFNPHYKTGMGEIIDEL